MDFAASEWAALASYLDEALDLPPEAQELWLKSLNGLEPRLKDALAEMLQRNSQPDDPAVFRTLPKLGTDPFDASLSPLVERIGPYRLVKELGSGGMGTVWMAERVDGTLTRRVALKLPHAIGKRHFLDRFRRERDILASFTHPNIAQIYDAGATESGRPYIALEYVDGSSITQHCESLGLSTTERLQLFFQVLSAVQYAHNRLVIHRDLKPSNILATPAGEVKLLDFGIAKLLRPEGQESDVDLTEAGERAMTLDYAAPEQILGQPVGTAADIYSLGVVLFELLTGKRPYSLRGNPSAVPEQAITSLHVARPSDVARQESKPHWKTLRGDLDAIVLKALRTDPAERYPTADALSQDLHRFLNGEPVSAQPETFGYGAGKFVRRNKVPVLASAAVFLALAIGLGLALWQAREARKAARTATAVETFVTDIFRANSEDQPDPAKARATTARQLLDIGAGKLQGSLNDAPEAKLEVLSTLSSMYTDLGIDDTAVKLTREQLQLARSVFGNNSPKVAEILVTLAGQMQSSSFVQERPGVLQEAREILDRAGDSSSTVRARLLIAIAEDYAAKDQEKALEFAREAVAVSRRTKPDDLISALFQNAVILSRMARDREALPVLSEGIRISQQEHWKPMLLKLYVFQADAHLHLLDVHDAEQSYRDAYQLAKSLNGAEHIDTMQTEARLGAFLAEFARDREGISLLEDAYRIALKLRGPEDSFHVPMLQDMYGLALARYGRVKAGTELIRMAIANRRKNRPGTLYLAQMLEELASYEVDLGRYGPAEKDLGEAETIRKSKPRVVNSERIRLLLAEGKSQEAAKILDRRAIPEAMTTFALQALQDRAAVDLAEGNFESAIRVASMARAKIAAHPDHQSLANWDESLAQIEAEADLASGKVKVALTLFHDLVRRRTARLDPNSPAIVESRLGAAEAAGKAGQNLERRQFCAAAKMAIGEIPLGEPYQKRWRRVCAESKY